MATMPPLSAITGQLWAVGAFEKIDARVFQNSAIAAQSAEKAAPLKETNWGLLASRVAIMVMILLPGLVGLTSFAEAFPIPGLAVAVAISTALFLLFRNTLIPPQEDSSRRAGAPASSTPTEAKIQLADFYLKEAVTRRDADLPKTPVAKTMPSVGKMAKIREATQVAEGLLLLKIDHLYKMTYEQYLEGASIQYPLGEMGVMSDALRIAARQTHYIDAIDQMKRELQSIINPEEKGIYDCEIALLHSLSELVKTIGPVSQKLKGDSDNFIHQVNHIDRSLISLTDYYALCQTQLT